ncbi:nickel-dependent hydrogenase large subunit [Orenia marismortui]|uniref:Hydrogenase large subunit n=1 Tax=Orenia marismortui TaxID=46469 RepID=A0A4R8GZW5_9FIRM|nr:nickel-dependent hydrogenase large subunit [Orenia marismortui]TDX52400.1 hydrogenase large subunit [Orenia marismortui]
MSKKVTFSPVTRLSGILSVKLTIDNNIVVDADASSTMFRGFEWIMRDRHVTDAVYMTQRVCGICSLAHGAIGSYLLDELYDNQISEDAQYLRNIMYGADFLQNHIRQIYFFSLPDYVKMPNRPPFHGQNLLDARLKPRDNQCLVDNYFKAIKIAQQSHQILALFGGKAPHQHSFVHGGVAVAPTVDKINTALSLVEQIHQFVSKTMLPDIKLISRVYSDYFEIGVTPRRLLSFGLWRFGAKNEKYLWKGGVLRGNRLAEVDLDLINEGIINSWFEGDADNIYDGELEPEPLKESAYSWIKTVKYKGEQFETGPLARLIINGLYKGGTSTMDRIMARALETLLITELMIKWLAKLKPSQEAPIKQNKEPIKDQVIATNDAMRGALLHSAKINDEEVIKYNIITPTVWNFSPKDQYENLGPVENAMVGTKIRYSGELYTILGRIIRSFDPCMSCATHVLDLKGNVKDKVVF